MTTMEDLMLGSGGSNKWICPECGHAQHLPGNCPSCGAKLELEPDDDGGMADAIMG